MRKNARANIGSLMFQSQGIPMAILFFFIAGLSSGIFAELFLGADEKLPLAEYLTNQLLSQDLSKVSLSSVFLQSAANNLGLLLLFFIGGLTVIGFPAVFLAVAYKGMALGFSSALLIDSLAGKGIKVIFLSMVPQNVILLPVLLAAAVAAVHFSAAIYAGRDRGIKKSLAQYTGPYLTIFMILAAIAIVGCAAEAFIAPALLRLAG